LLQAGALQTPQRDLAVLRGEAIACAGGFDARRVAKIKAEEGDNPIWSVDFSRDGTRLATAGGEGTVRLWKISGDDVTLERTLKDPKGDIKKLYYPQAPLPVVAFDPGGKYLAYATWDNSIAFLPLTADAAPLQPIVGEAQPRGLSFDSAGATLAVSWIDGQIVVYKFPKAEKVRTFQTPGRMESFQRMPVALSPDGKKLAALGANYTVVIYPLDADGPPVTLGRHRDKVQQLMFSPDSKWLASAAHDQTAKIWSADGKTEPVTLLGHSNRVHGVAFSPDGTLLATASDDQTARIWEVRSGQTMIVVRPENESVLAVRFSPDGRLATARTTLAVYRLTDRRERRSFVGHTYAVNNVAFHPRLPVLASASSDKDIILWDLATSRPAKRFRGHNNKEVYGVVYSPDGAWLAAGHQSFYNFRSTDHDVRVWDAATGQEQIRLRGPVTDILAVRFDPSSARVAAGGTSGIVYLWDRATGQAVWQTNDLGGGVLGLAFREGNQLVAGLHNGVVLLNAADGQTIRTARSPARRGSRWRPAAVGWRSASWTARSASWTPPRLKCNAN
jgi:WD40 repeat protein